MKHNPAPVPIPEFFRLPMYEPDYFNKKVNFVINTK